MPSEMIKWPYLSALGLVREEVNKFLDNLSKKEIITGMSWMPPLDVSETNESVIVRVEVPGIEPKDVDISVRGDILTMKGEKKAEREEKGKNYHCVERSCGYFSPVNFTSCSSEVRSGKG